MVHGFEPLRLYTITAPSAVMGGIVQAIASWVEAISELHSDII
ncbi:hypothetical protein PMG71_11055 [Roseofilum sp. BLCC_M154]|uniref:Uncharacterized protein n=1 Tax=Roseofilum acuticapitatum BLCC-M154 TaxID=3022444 RepID=A0ABT7AST1_9CYAN|nr:hypothetical protein [Roseofilum acuticapitatum]MDJ1169965.1 hypothetical protein [Roseofilum acuticapitatum BLCC-M154]